MLISRLQTTTVAEAIETTFDGEHPCPMCSAIDAGKKKEKKQEQNLPALKKVQDAKFVEVRGFELPACVTTGDAAWPHTVVSGSLRADAPPTPPPLA